MRYADSRCKITKDEKNDIYIVSGKDMFTGTAVEVRIPGPALFAYRQGALIQDAMPMLSLSEREFLISGMFDSFDDLVPEEDE